MRGGPISISPSARMQMAPISSGFQQASCPGPDLKPTSPGCSDLRYCDEKQMQLAAFSIASSGCLAQGAQAASWAAGFPPVGRGVGPAGTLPEGPGLWVTRAGQSGTTQIGGYGESVPRHLPSGQSAIGVLADLPCQAHTAWLPMGVDPHARAPPSL